MSRLLNDPLQVATTIDNVLGEHLHASRVVSLANRVVGFLHTAVLSIDAIGRANASAFGGNETHGGKQTDRLPSDPGIDVRMLVTPWVGCVAGEREALVAAPRWLSSTHIGHPSRRDRLLFVSSTPTHSWSNLCA